MKNLFKLLNKPMLIASVAFIVLGAMFAIEPDIIGKEAISYVIAGALFMYALISVIIYIKTPVGSSIGLILGLCGLGAGIIICFTAAVFVTILQIFIGFGIVVFGIIRIQQGIDLLRMKRKSGWIEFAVGIILIAAGILVVFTPEWLKNMILMLAGIFMIVVGVTNIISEIRTKKALKNAIAKANSIVIDVDEDGE